MSFKLISVGISDIKIASSPDILRTVLGSCVGVCLYDTEKRLAGLSHIMLPSMNSSNSNLKKYADTAIPLMLDKMIGEGASYRNITAKIAGGATMFKLLRDGFMNEIGKNNIKKVKEVLDEMSIKIIAEDVGGDFGRTIDFYSEDGRLKVKSIGRYEKII